MRRSTWTLKRSLSNQFFFPVPGFPFLAFILSSAAAAFGPQDAPGVALGAWRAIYLLGLATQNATLQALGVPGYKMLGTVSRYSYSYGILDRVGHILFAAKGYYGQHKEGGVYVSPTST